jgi:formylglycine-generating enzyme required for sulfatase activity
VGEEIRLNLEKADIVLLLITRHFLASDYCYEKEMQRAVQRHYEGNTRVIPIILETCGWKYSDFKHLQVLPQDGKPISRWADRADAFFNIEEGIRRVVDALNAERRQAEEAARLQLEVEHQPKLEAERQRKQREAEAQLERERQAAEQRRREQEAERLKREAEAEQRQRQQKLEAQRQEQERQKREAAERLRQQQAEAEQREKERQQQLAAERQRQRDTAAARRQQGQTAMGRRRAMQIAGLGSGSLVLALGAGSLWKSTQNSGLNLSPFEFEVVTVNETGEIADRQTKQANEFREDLGDGVLLNMVEIPAGEFMMGSPPEEEDRDDDEGPQRTVSVPRFFMGRFQVTQAQYEAVMGENPSNFEGANRPVEKVSWNDAVAFCEKLSQMTGRTYRLPSEAEWEYACRAGTTTPFHFGPTITTELANYNGNETYGSGPEGLRRGETTEVGSFPPNAFGLHDMHGNVWEWCQDVWHGNYEGAPTDGSAWIEGGDQERRVLRGGSWCGDPGGLPVGEPRRGRARPL